MSISWKIAVYISIVIVLLIIGACVFRRFAPRYETLFPLLISVIALAVSLVSNFKNELFDFRLRVVAGDITFATPTAPSHKSIAVILQTTFINGLFRGISG